MKLRTLLPTFAAPVAVLGLAFNVDAAAKVGAWIGNSMSPAAVPVLGCSGGQFVAYARGYKKVTVGGCIPPGPCPPSSAHNIFIPGCEAVSTGATTHSGACAIDEANPNNNFVGADLRRPDGSRVCESQGFASWNSIDYHTCANTFANVKLAGGSCTTAHVGAGAIGFFD